MNNCAQDDKLKTVRPNCHDGSDMTRPDVSHLVRVQLLSVNYMLFLKVTRSYPRYIIATKALITKANGLAILGALLFGEGEGELLGAPDVEPAVPVGFEDVSVAGTDVITVLVLDRVARLSVVLREARPPVPVPIAPVPTGTVVTLRGITVVTTGRLLLLLTLLMTDCSDDTSDETDAEAADVTDAAEAEVLDTDTADEADTAVADDAFLLTDDTTSDPPV